IPFTASDSVRWNKTWLDGVPLVAVVKDDTFLIASSLALASRMFSLAVVSVVPIETLFRLNCPLPVIVEVTVPKVVPRWVLELWVCSGRFPGVPPEPVVTIARGLLVLVRLLARAA